MSAGLASGAHGDAARATGGDPDVKELERLLRRSFAGLELPGAPRAEPTQTREGGSDPFSSLSGAGFGAYGSGTVQHTAAPLADEEAPADSDIGLSDAAHAGSALGSWRDELGRVSFPALVTGASYGRGSSLEIRRPDQDKADAPIVQVEPAVATAPPSSQPVIRRPVPADAAPILEGGLLRAEAGARAIPSGCVIGSDLSIGLGSADRTDVGDVDGDPQSRAPLLSLTKDGEGPFRATSQSLSRTRLVPLEGQAGRFGVLAEVRQTIAPVTIFEGDPDREITIEIAGEWVLRAVADGTTGSVALGVEKVRDRLPVLRIKFPGEEFTLIDDLADLRRIAGSGGLVLDLGNGAELVIGEPVRSLGGEAGSDPTATAARAAGAVDILRIQRKSAPKIALLRIGHMEAATAAPAGGVGCPGIGLAKTTDPPQVAPGERFRWSLEVSNPNDCRLENLTVTDATETDPDIGYRVALTTPPAKKRGRTIIFDALEPLGPGEKRTLLLDVEVEPDAPPGRFVNRATANGVCGAVRVGGSGTSQTVVDQTGPLPVDGTGGIAEPEVLSRPATVAPEGGATGAGGREVLPAPAPAPAPRAEPVPVPAPVTPGPVSQGGKPAPRPPATVRSAVDALAGTGATYGVPLGTALLGAGMVLRRCRRR